MRTIIRNILISALCLVSFNSCRVDGPETSKYHLLSDLAEHKASSRLEFPMVMAETAMSIEAYEGMTAEEKLGMGYIYENLMKTGEGQFGMKDFYGFTLDMQGRSISEPGAEWFIKAYNGSFGRYVADFTMYFARQQDGEYDYKLVCNHKGYPAYEVLFSEVEDDEAFYSWIMEVSTRFTTGEGRVVTISTAEPVSRKVYRAQPKDPQSYVMMKGALEISFEGDADGDGTLELLDVVRCEYDGRKHPNERYNF